MDPDLVEEIRMWFEETNGSADLLSEWFDIPIRNAKQLICNWEDDDVDNEYYG